MTALLSSRAHGLAVGAGLSMMLTAFGCADPQGAFDDFAQRWDQIAADAGTTPDAPDDTAPPEAGDGNVPDVVEEPLVCNLPAAGDVAAYYYVAFSVKLAPPKPIMFLGTLTWDGTALSMVFQPLAASDHQTPAGTPVQGGPFSIAADGSFVADMGSIEVTGTANPISGSDIATTGVLHAKAGSFCAPVDFLCGEVTGTVSKPDYLVGYDLTGSTFTMQRMDSPTAFPEILINCDKDKAQY